MKPKEFIVAFSTYYREPLIIDGRPSIRLTTIEKWISGFQEDKIQEIYDKIVVGFIPTSTNPCPLIPHIIDICEIQTTEKSKMELARTVADAVVYSILNIGSREPGSRQRAIEHIGKLGCDVLQKTYGKWHIVCEIAQSESIEVMRSHIRDSVYAYINRTEKGIEDQAPELEDLTTQRTDIKKIIGDLSRLKAIE